MKKMYATTLLLFLALGTYAQYGEIPNSGFENWSNLDVYDYPTDWSNSNVDQFGAPSTVFQSTDAQDGTYACELQATMAGPQDTVFGYVYHGFLGQSGPSGGIPYNINFDEMQFHYKCDLAVGDTLFVLAARFIAGVLVGTEVVEAAVGTQSNWTAGSVSFPNGAQDQLFIGFVLNNPLGNQAPSPGSWARVDNASMYNAGISVTNIPDPSFENWTNVSTENPDDWNTLNPLLSSFGGENAIKTTDANTGSFAIEMTTTQPFPGGDTVASFLSIGEINLSSTIPFMNVPYNAIPSTFSGAYKYAPSNGDEAFVQLAFYQNGIPIAFENQLINASATWQTFSTPLTILGQPDSISLIAYSGDNPGSVLHLDDIVLSGGDVGLDDFSKMNIDIYPNPATTSVMIKAEGSYTYSIINLSGQTVLSDNDLSGAVLLDIQSFPRGAYFVTISNDQISESYKLIIE